MTAGPNYMTRMTIFFALLGAFCLLGLIQVPSAAARDWLVPEQAPTIQAAIDSCVSGDVVDIAPGIYTDCTNLNENVLHIAVLTSGVSLRGRTGNPADVILDAGYVGRCLEIRNSTEETIIEGITLRRGKAVSPFGKGGAVFSIFSDPIFRTCVFDSNQAEFGGGGISASYGSLTVESCVFTHNSTEGIGAAVQTSRAPTEITSSTIYGSTGTGVHYATDGLTMSNTIIYGGDGASVLRNLETDPDPEITCCDFFGNEEDYPEFIETLQDIEGNISADPLFCNPLFGDYHLYAISPCGEESSGDCGQIGALPVNCGFGSVTWILQPDGTGDFPNIQAAINSAANGDTIALADGVFTGDGNRDLDYLGKSLVIKGHSGDPQLAIIDCQGTPSEPHRAFHFQGDETSFSVLRDLTITGGEATADGGAIYCESNPIIENVVFDHNGADRGGAIFVDGAEPQIIGCTFSENRGDSRAGGIALFGSEAVITDCLFTGNWGYIGSAVFLPDSSTVTLEGCTITANNSSLDKDCLGVDGNSALSISNCQVTFNSRRAARNYGAGSVSISGSNVFGNAEGDYTGPISGSNGQSGNISADPLYCDAEARDFTLRADSPCTETNAPNQVQMGPFGVGCSAPNIFTDITTNLPESNALSGGVSWLDWNGDNHLDFMVANTDGANEIMTGDGTGQFTIFSDPLLTMSAAQTQSVAWADFDNDGDLDAYQSHDNLFNMLASNDEGVFNIEFTENLDRQGLSGGSCWSDFNGDGNLDLFVASLDSACVLLKGDGLGGFVEVEADSLDELTGVADAAWADSDNDGDLDLYVIKDDAANFLLENDDSSETFTALIESPLNAGGNGRGAAWGDYDNDGDLDLFLTRNGQGNQLLRNNGSNNFVNKTTGPLGYEGQSGAGIWGDYDNDGDLDLFVTVAGEADQLLRNSGGGVFINTADAAFASSDSSTGAAWGDFDEDGDLDLIIADRGGRTRLRRNDQDTGNNWLRVRLTGYEGQAVCQGARISVTTPGDSVQIREIGGGGWLSFNEPVAHFGLASADTITTLEITWPSGRIITETDLLPNQVLSFVEPEEDDESPVDDVPVHRLSLMPAWPNPFNPATTIQFEVTRQSKVQMDVYDVRGRHVQELLSEEKSPGRHSVTWRGRDKADRQVAAGVYLVRLKTQGQQGTAEQTRTIGITLLK